jgi:peptide/nickel transport system ATP-binding protein
MAIVGPSGAGKSTLGRCIAGHESVTSGSVSLEGFELPFLRRKRRNGLPQRVQLVLQSSATALNPRFTGAEIVTEPLIVSGVARSVAIEQALQMIEAVGLPRETSKRLPSELSGGERQRLAIARALTLYPSLLILDEAFSGLDHEVQRRILDLLADLREQYSLTYLVISHDLGLVQNIADVVGVMHQGRMVAKGPAEDILSNPRHLQTATLLEATPGASVQAGGA